MSGRSTTQMMIAACIGAAVALPISTARANVYTWTGASASGTGWGDAANWSPSSGFPVGTGDVAIFAGTASNFAQPDYTGDSSLNVAAAIDFQSAGWTINHGPRTLNFPNSVSYGITSAGAGVNKILTNFYWKAPNSQSIDVGTDNTLWIDSPSLRLDNTLHKNGPGTLVLSGTAAGAGSPSAVTVDGGTVLINYVTDPVANATRYSANGGGTLGGSGTLNITQPANNSNAVQTRIGEDGNGGTLSPGGDGTTAGGARIGTLTFVYSATGSGNLVRLYDGATFAVDLSATSGVSDLLDIQVQGTGATGGYFDLTAMDTVGQALALNGPAMLSPGNTYTIATFANTNNLDYGTFESVTYNGASAAGLIDVIYNPNSIVLQVVPEPASLALLAVGGLGLLRRRC